MANDEPQGVVAERHRPRDVQEHGPGRRGVGEQRHLDRVRLRQHVDDLVPPPRFADIGDELPVGAELSVMEVQGESAADERDGVRARDARQLEAGRHVLDERPAGP
ncbi:hypothetical protein [Nannocystis pusilla]|uniref:hypothetical protein n=1 Tax=Nannocystis pusilla TaxID=889268 RepID=UPI003DA34A81